MARIANPRHLWFYKSLEGFQTLRGIKQFKSISAAVSIFCFY